MRRGIKSVRPTVICYIEQHSEVEPHFGFVVSKAVGNAPVRNLIRRRLRAIVQERLGEIHADVVIRPLPAAASASWESLRRDVLSGLGLPVERP
jgi:ribonuclease P protein component